MDLTERRFPLAGLLSFVGRCDVLSSERVAGSPTAIQIDTRWSIGLSSFLPAGPTKVKNRTATDLHYSGSPGGTLELPVPQSVPRTTSTA